MSDQNVFPFETVDSDEVPAVPLQPASLDIWRRKYRLQTRDGKPVDKSVDDTWRRVARALAEVEATPELRQKWEDAFFWALRHGAIPAGRIVSNAGAQEHKPATSTINCTVSGTIEDSMDDILAKVHEAGLTLKAGCGIGYEFSTLRPRGAWVSGAGAQTSGPLSFMDIYDRVCFTISSAGGRRGAQMATFDICHPDVLEFIRAKREPGRLRQFNLSLLITDEFIEAVKVDADWPLLFPLRQGEAKDFDLNNPEQVRWRSWPTREGLIVDEEGQVACRIYRKLRARRLWDVIMSSTYDFAEPGFILIDRVNALNNNWFCETIRATNPCVTADTWVQTDAGPKQVAELVDKAFNALVDGKPHRSTEAGFFRTATRPVVRLVTQEGYQLRLTRDHRLRRVLKLTPWQTLTEWCEAGELRQGDRVLLNNHRQTPKWQGKGTWSDGHAFGLRIGAVHKGNAAPCAIAAGSSGTGVVVSLAGAVANIETFYSLGKEPPDTGCIAITPEIERASSDFYRGLFTALYDLNGIVLTRSNSILLSLPDGILSVVQRMLLRLGIHAHLQRKNGSHHLAIKGDNLEVFARSIDFSEPGKKSQLRRLLSNPSIKLRSERFVATVETLLEEGTEDVYDAVIPGINTFDANGFHAHNCGEQPLPPYGACLLGSVNLTRFVRLPFTEKAYFDWEMFREVVSIFTRMLDNVVEINGLPLPQQREEIMRKRRHGMGFLGLGSTLTMLRMTYGSTDSLQFTEDVSRELALTGWREGLALAKEKGPAPLLIEEFEVTPELLRKRPELLEDGYKPGDRIKGSVLHARYSRYMQKIAEMDPELIEQLADIGSRFTHHSSIAPTGTISLSLANNASNGIEPSFAHHYSRNVIREGKKSKEKVDVFSYELLAYRELMDADAMPDKNNLPDYFVSSDDISPDAHIAVQAAAQKWIDSSISKTINVPTDFPYNDFKDIYLKAWEQELKGCTTFRFNPEAFQGVLVKEKDLENTIYEFRLENGEVVRVKGNEEIEYDGEIHTAANLYDALKEGYYGKY